MRTEAEIIADLDSTDRERQAIRNRARHFKAELLRASLARNIKVKLRNGMVLKPAEQEYVASLSDAERDGLVELASTQHRERLQRAMANVASVGAKAK
jgi:hypothetical protein